MGPADGRRSGVAGRRAGGIAGDGCTGPGARGSDRHQSSRGRRILPTRRVETPIAQYVIISGKVSRVKWRLSLVMLVLAAASCADGTPTTSFPPGCDNEIHTCMAQRTTPPPTVIDASKKYSATVHTTRGDFVISFVDAKIAPQTVNNFVYLAQNHFYDKLTFHRVVAGIVVQGGDPLGNATGGPAYN